MGSFYKPVNESQTVSATADRSVTCFFWKHAPTRGLDNIDYAAQNLWDTMGRGVNGKYKGDDAGTQFSSLTRNEKLKLVEDYLRFVYLHLASEQNVRNQEKAAIATATAENATKFDLSD